MRWLVVILSGSAVALTALAFATNRTPTAGAAEPKRPAASPKSDWTQLGGSPTKNNVAPDDRLPTAWDLGRFDKQYRPVPGTGTNIKWVVEVHAGSWPFQFASGPAVAGGKVFVGSNNFSHYVARLPKVQDWSCLLCFREADGQFLWQFSSEKLAIGRSQDNPANGLMSTPYVEADRLWIVSNQNEIVCLDTEGFADGENDGPYRNEPNEHADEADIVWKLDLRERFGALPLHLARSSITAAGDVLFVCTSSGKQRSLDKATKSTVPSFLALDKNKGTVLWSAAAESPILDGQWSSPALGTLAGKPQVLFGGGDGWLYSFSPTADKDGQAQLLWKFDANSGRMPVPQDAHRPLSQSITGAPVIYNDRVYAAIGSDPELGFGRGCLWCIDPSRQGNVSAEIEGGPNPNSAVVWKYEQFDLDGNGNIEVEETMHLANGLPAIQDDLLVIADIEGIVHCLDAKTGRPHWAHDMGPSCNTTPLIAGGHVYVGNEDGDMFIFELSAQKQLVAKIAMQETILGAPVIAGGVLYVLTLEHLWAIAAPIP